MVENWGVHNDRPVFLYTLTNSHGTKALITNFGATWTSLYIKDKNGIERDVLVGRSSLAEYLEPHPKLGSTCGRVVNRIPKGQFTLNGVAYQLACNHGPDAHIHGGNVGWDKAVWTSEEMIPGQKVQFSHTSPDGDEGYPGTVGMRIIYELNE
jgi:aldose 1-epimerase